MTILNCKTKTQKQREGEKNPRRNIILEESERKSYEDLKKHTIKVERTR